MKTRKGMETILRRIMDKSDIEDEEMMSDIAAIRQDYEDRDAILSTYGDIPEDVEDFQFSAREGGIDWEGKYKRLKEQYVNRFFGSPKVKDEHEDIIDEMEKDVIRDGEDQTIDELLERTEG